MKLTEVFKDNIVYYRKKMNLSQERLAELSDLSTNYIGEIERKNKKVTIETIEKLAIGLKIDPAILLTKRPKK